MYNQIKHLPEPQYEHSQRFAKSYTDKVRKKFGQIQKNFIQFSQGLPITFLRIPFQPLSQIPPSAPSTTSYLARSTPVLASPVVMQPPPYSAHKQAPIGWAINDISNEHSSGNFQKTKFSNYLI